MVPDIHLVFSKIEGRVSWPLCWISHPEPIALYQRKRALIVLLLSFLPVLCPFVAAANSYDASDVGPAVDKQFGPRRRSIGMCSVLAVLEFRDHSHCQFPLSIKRWSHDKVHMEFIECLGQKYRASGLVDAAWMDGSPEKWETARRLGESCFDAVKIWGPNTQRNILCAKDDMEKRQSLFQSIIVGNGAAKVATDPQGRNVVEYCMKGSQIKKELKNPRSPRDWSLMPER